MVVALLIAGGAIAHAAWNLVAKRASLSGPAFVWLTSLGAAVVTAPLAIVLAVLDPPPLDAFLLAIAVSGLSAVSVLGSGGTFVATWVPTQ